MFTHMTVCKLSSSRSIAESLLKDKHQIALMVLDSLSEAESLQFRRRPSRLMRRKVQRQRSRRREQRQHRQEKLMQVQQRRQQVIVLGVS